MIPIAQPMIGEAEATAAAEVIRVGLADPGLRVASFEAAFAAQVGAGHACAVAKLLGCVLHLALLAVGVMPGDEVITVSHTFIACANSIWADRPARSRIHRHRAQQLDDGSRPAGTCHYVPDRGYHVRAPDWHAL